MARTSTRLSPRPPTASGSSPSIDRRKARGRLDPTGPGAWSRALTTLNPARPMPRLSTTSSMARTICRSCSPARLAPTATASGDFDPATLHKAFDGLRFDAGAHFELDLGREGPREALAFAALVERAGVNPADTSVSFGLDPFAASARGPFPVEWTAEAAPYLESALKLRGMGFGAPLMTADARGVHAAGGSPAQELAFALAASVSLLRLLDGAGRRLPKPARSSRSGWRPTPINSRPCRNSARCESSGRGSRTRAASNPAQRMSTPKARGA